MQNKSIEKLKVLFFGMGSIGKKHARIIKENFNFDIYAYRTKKGQEKDNLKIKEFMDIEDAFSIQPDIAFITNPTFLHIQTAIECTKRNIDLFIEKPLSHSFENVIELESEIKKRNIFTYIAYNLRFHPVITNLKKEISTIKEKPIYFKNICSTYLPSWRSNQDYSKSYSAKKESGGGVILDLSHEFDYIKFLFGEIKSIKGYYDKVSNLKIDSEDVLEAQLILNSGLKGNLHLDYFSQKNERRIQIYYNDKYLEGDLIKNNIKIIKENGKEKIIKYRCNIDDTYYKQIQYFFQHYLKKDYNISNNFSDALITFKKIMQFKNEYSNTK
jgi:predicted dehydrogenase